MTNFEDVIRDVALKNRYSVRETDTVMALVTILNRIAEDWQNSMDAALEAHCDAYETLAHRWRESSTARAETILKLALTAGKDAMAKGMNEGAVKIVELIRAETASVIASQKAALAETVEMTEKLRRYAIWMIAANGAIMLLALLIAICR